MHIHKYALMRIRINALLRICVIVSQTVQGHHPDRICIMVHCAQPIRIIFMNTHYNGLFTSTLKTDSEHWTRSLKTEWEKFSPGLWQSHFKQLTLLFEYLLSDITHNESPNLNLKHFSGAGKPLVVIPHSWQASCCNTTHTAGKPLVAIPHRADKQLVLIPETDFKPLVVIPHTDGKPLVAIPETVKNGYLI